MKREALFCDGTGNYVSPAEPLANGKVTLRFRTAANDVEHVFLLVNGEGHTLRKEKTVGMFDYYVTEWKLGEERFQYSFMVQNGHEVLYYNQCGVFEEEKSGCEFAIMPGFATPDWAKGAVMYQIFTDRFCNGDEANDVEDGEYFYIKRSSRKIKEWNQCPAVTGEEAVGEFYGGDLQGVRNKLDYLQELGVEVIYFNPLFVSPSNHKYDTQDYDYIDPHFGIIVEDGGNVLSDGVGENVYATKYQKRVADKKNLEASNQFFVELVEEMHKRGMKVILDGVFNHCGSFNKWMDRERIYEHQDGYEKGAYVSADSKYRNFFKFTQDAGEDWPYNKNYQAWWDFETLPKLNYEDSKELEEYILEIGRKWVSPPYNIDGWRMDVAADLGHSPEYNHSFWKKFRKVVKEANPNAIILAEHYGDPKAWLKGDEWDTVMNYDAFMEPITWFLTGMEKHSDEYRPELLGDDGHFVYSMTHNMSRYLTPSLQVAMNELSNHDHSRFLTRTNHVAGRVHRFGSKAADENVDASVMREAVVMQMTWVGAPTLYYGDEAGLCGFTDPDNRRTYPWGNEDKELIAFHKDMIRIHKESDAFRTGSLKILGTRRDVLSYARFQGEDRYVVIINNAEKGREVTIPVWQAEVPVDGRMKLLIYTDADGYSMEKKEYSVVDGNVKMTLGAHCAVVLKG